MLVERKTSQTMERSGRDGDVAQDIDEFLLGYELRPIVVPVTMGSAAK